ncbi:hypothetical protein P3X46_018582 [Hevea brasiliensis]|uniref:Uncharacterized protein n=2 Tax=Hevea brasiliensis TaxID=3981 RepID=A0A6A6L6P4_HEVBR|nr:uncharacterized protein At5g65660 [Hevea brasiliensis]KAF2295736.1 hypothetical protein GH714_033771 [Hevea brasiliensis]KAJ9170476.1 hypothetical protein P3X46_018582 [Hevea brasiliensis]
MESPDFSPLPHVDASRPSIGFPIGTALLLIIVFTLSCIFSCCYHWDKLRSNRRTSSDDPDPEVDIEASPTKSHTDLKQNESQSLPVIMPGDQIPKFIALPCPCESTRAEEVIVTVHRPPSPKPPRVPVPMF